MLTITTTAQFERDLQRLRQEGKELDELWAVVELLVHEIPLDSSYQDHALQGVWAGCRECHLAGDWLLAYRIQGKELQLARTGTHADLFRPWRNRK
jgi:mRNA interferase YafQ